MAFLESNGVHYRALCDGCGAIGSLGETTTIAESSMKRAGWKNIEGRLLCERCGRICHWAECHEQAQPLTVYCAKHSRQAEKNLRALIAVFPWR